MREILKEHWLLILCGFVSIILLSIFSIMQYYDSNVLKLESKWLAISGVPLLVALFGGGYITRFKGFGLELESKLKSPVQSITLKTVDAATRLQGEEKVGISYLDSLSEDEIKQFKILKFVSGKENYYDQQTVMDYLHRLNCLEYVGVTKENGEFICALPISKFKGDNCNINNSNFDYYKVSTFIQSVERNNVVRTYRNACITLAIKQDESLIIALKRLRDESTDKAAVVNSKKFFVGILTEREVEHRIADDVLSTQPSTRISTNRSKK